MRNGLLALLTLVLASTAALAQGAWADNLFPEGTSHNFGSVPRGAQLLHRFKLRNIYDAQLEITNTRTSCGCVTVTVRNKQDQEARVLQRQKDDPSDLFVDVVMDARRFTGQKTVSIYVTVGPQYVSTATLQVSAYSRPDVVFNPGEVSFGVVQRGQTPKQVIDVEYAGMLDWRVYEVVKNQAPLDVTLTELYRRPGQVGYRVEVAIKPDAPPGALKQELLLRTNDPSSPLVPVLVEASIQAPLTVVPSLVTVGSLKVGETKVLRVMLRGSKPFRIVAVEGQGDGVVAEVPRMPSPTQFVTLRCQPLKAGDLHRQLRIKTDLDQEAPVTVTVEGRVAAR